VAERETLRWREFPLSIEIHPRRLRGPWDAGFALDIHTVRSNYLGNDQYGHPRFDTKRSPIGELLYRLKYKRDQTTIEPIVEAIVGFLGTQHSPIDAIVPVPPSNVRTNQPVTLIVAALSKRLQIPVCAECITKTKKTTQLKDLTEYHKRVEALEGAFSVSPEHTQGKSLLLFDDLHGSGVTASEIVKVLKGPGGAKAVYFLTLTTK
jgi:predicted amidophosphoribosyltransferase